MHNDFVLEVIFDMDDVIYDFVPTIIKTINEKENKQLTLKDATEWNLKKCLSPNVNDYFCKKGFMKTLPLKKDAILMNTLVEDNRFWVKIASAAHPTSYDDKTFCLKRDFPLINQEDIHYLHDKYKVRGHVIIDDKIENLVAYKEAHPHAVCLLYDMPYNRHCDEFNRVSTMREIINIVNNLYIIYTEEDDYLKC